MNVFQGATRTSRRRNTAVALLAAAASLLSITAVWAAEPLRNLDAATWKAFAESRQGRPMIVHFWGLTCGNCMVELKDWGRFAAEHPGTEIVLVNWDRRNADRKRMGTALTESGLGHLPSFALADGYEEKLRFAVDHDWQGELPYTRLVAGDGSVTTFSGTADFTKLTQWLDGTIKHYD